MRPRGYLAMVGLVAVLSLAAPVAQAAPPAQQPLAPAQAAPLVTPALEAAMLQGILAVFPADTFAGQPPRFLPLQRNLYLVSHPALFWRVEQEPAAKALAAQLAARAPGWGTTLSNGPQGYGVYLTYHPNG